MFELAIDGRVARISLNRGEARNAVPTTQWAALADAATQAVDRGARALILRSAVTGTFCAGADLCDLEALAGDPAAQRVMRTAMGDALERLTSLPIPVIAAIDGSCFGAGVALAMACDIRVGGHGAQFAIPPARLGITYPQPDIARLVALVGPGQAARLLLSGERIGVDEAYRIGLVEMKEHTAHHAVEMMAEICAESAPSSVALLKSAIVAASRGDRDGEAFATAFERSFDSADFAEGIAAMRGRRAPVFGE